MRDGDYYGPTLNRTARVMDAGHGGQILLSAATAELADELEMTDLGEHRLKGIASPIRLFQLGAEEFPALRTPLARAGNMPTELNEFVGRETEIADVVAELAGHRVVTLLGVGGTGKTRLSIEAAAAAAPTFPDGCWYVELATVAIAGAVELAFAAGLGLKAVTEGERDQRHRFDVEAQTAADRGRQLRTRAHRRRRSDRLHRAGRAQQSRSWRPVANR